ncbi:hypothetical protein [Pseudomonas syringae]|uniref:hypothetical protein n=1 Tax=Pseudomonas syringae TaxID=317 RepID=UPI0002099D47|nr:hypothetical protein [Pseudomonas syringae]EGH74770.1 hypothetical protein PSYAR_29929 [Pseudomonas syringae pv. aceris str. M302273]PBP42884.1 hypothetical protein CCL11_15150 [Pseudomonas syringae]
MTNKTKNFSAWMRGSDIQASIYRCESIFNSGVFNTGNSAGILFESALTHLLINLHDLMQKARIDEKRIVFTDDIELTKSIADITDLVSTCRNAVCHISSGEHLIDSGKFTFCVVTGLSPNAFVINDKARGCEHIDDIAVYFGETRIYLKRHLLRAFELIAKLYGTNDSW